MVTDFIHLFDDAAKLKIPTFFKTILGAVRNYVISVVEGGQ